MKTLSFTGHRPNKLNGYDAVANRKLLLHIKDVIEDINIFT